MFWTFTLYNLLLVAATNWSNSFISAEPSEVAPRAVGLSLRKNSFHTAAALSVRFSKWAEACREADTVSPFPLRCSDKTRPRLRFVLHLSSPAAWKRSCCTDRGLHTWRHEAFRPREKVGRDHENTSFSAFVPVFRNCHPKLVLLLAAVAVPFHPSCTGSGAAGSPCGGVGGISDVTEKKPQQCALLSAPSRGVRQQSTASELLCLILLCRLCLSFFLRLNTKASPQRWLEFQVVQ